MNKILFLRKLTCMTFQLYITIDVTINVILEKSINVASCFKNNLIIFKNYIFNQRFKAIPKFNFQNL